MALPGVSAIGDVEGVAGDADAVRLVAAAREVADELQAPVVLDFEGGYGVAALVDREQKLSVLACPHLLVAVIRADALGHIQLPGPARGERPDAGEIARATISGEGQHRIPAVLRIVRLGVDDGRVPRATPIGQAVGRRDGPLVE